MLPWKIKMMKLVQVVFFLVSVCLFQSVSGDAPGDEHRLCLQDTTNEVSGSGLKPETSSNDRDTEVVLLDSYNYINLLDGVFPPPVWTRRSYQRGGDGWTTSSSSEICKQSVQVCDYEAEPGINNWLYTQYIDYLESKEVFVEVMYDLSECRIISLCSQSYISLYYHGTNGSCPEEQTDSTNYQYIERFNWWSSKYTTRLERPSSDEGFYLGFRDPGTCGSISRVRLYYKVCASKVDGLTSYPSLPLPAQSSQEPNIAYAYCAYNSFNSVASGYKAYGNGRCEYGARCECRLGYEEVTTATAARCRACPRGQYRSASDTSCQTCPSNTVRSGRAAAECPCLINYYRAVNEGPTVACTSPPSACRNLAVSDSSTHNKITVTWNRPSTTGRDDFYYNIYYSSSEDEGNFTMHNINHRYFMSSYEVSYTLTGLDPFTSYTIRVTVHNGVSDQDPTGKLSRQCEVTTATIPNDVAELDVLSGLALWTATDSSTQYQIRYNRTEDGNHGDTSEVDKPLEVYYVDSETKYTVEVRPWNQNRMGSWSTPIAVQFKARCEMESSSSTTEIYMPQTSCVSTELFTSTYINSNHYNYEDPCAAAIERIVIYYWYSYVYSIQVTYKLADGSLYTAPRRGYPYSSGTRVEVNFDKDEEIISITGGWNYFYNNRLTQLKIITMKTNGDHRVYGPYGGGSVTDSERFVVNANVVSFFGRASRLSSSIYGLGFKYRPQC